VPEVGVAGVQMRGEEVELERPLPLAALLLHQPQRVVRVRRVGTPSDDLKQELVRLQLSSLRGGGREGGGGVASAQKPTE
jgi:hypothetical protein